MAKEVMVKVNDALTENKGGNKMLKENEAVRYHCLHCNAVLNKKGRKYCDRDCYNASRKSNVAKTPAKEVILKEEVVEVPVNADIERKTPVSSVEVNSAESFEKALNNMKHFGSALTLKRLKKLVAIAGTRAHVIRVGGGIVIYWFINDEGYITYYAPGKLVTYKKSNLKDMRASINKLAIHKTYKDGMSITEYIELAEQMKGGE